MNAPRVVGFVVVLLSMLIASGAWAQGLRVVEPAAGSKVASTFSVKVEGPSGVFVRLVVANEEVARLKLSTSGIAEARVQAPQASPFNLVVEQLDGEEVVSMASIRLSKGADGTDSPVTATPAPSGEVDAAGADLPPPPPPPDAVADGAESEATSDDPPPPPNVDGNESSTEPDSPVISEPEANGGIVASPPPPSPSFSTRVVRIIIAGSVGLFVVPSGWMVAVVGAGMATNFDDEVFQRDIGWIFLVSGIISAAAGTWVTGELLKGNGSFLATLAGAVVVGGLSLFAFAGDMTGDAIILGSLLGSFASIGGAIVGYELTSDTDADFSMKTGIHDAVIGAAPTLDGRGFTVGLTGRF